MRLNAQNDIASPLLWMRGISKRFPGVKALDQVDFTLRRGEIHALMGENGAGKSTLVKVLTGVYRCDEGEIELKGRRVEPHSPREAQALGISTVYQEVNLIPERSVAENLFLGRQPRRFWGIDWKQIHRRARQALARLKLDIDVTQPLSSYPVAIQQMVAIARSLDVEAKLLVLDEPTSSLNAWEVERLFSVLRLLKARGLGILFITHFLDQVYAIADRITVLRNGRRVGEHETANLPRLELVAKMIGKDLDEVAAMTAAPERRGFTPGEGRLVLRAQGLRVGRAAAAFDLEIRATEVVGLAGLLGSGRTETARRLFGIDRLEQGRVEIEGESASMCSPREAIRRRLGFCPEDRKTDGIVPHLSVRENLLLALQARRGWLRRIGRKRQRELVDRYVQALNIATPDREKPVAELSGGNQQKVILARWLALEPILLILDEPTRGMDVGAKAEVEKIIARLSRDGMAILFISSELEEVVRNSHRVMVLRDRAKAGELSGEQIDLSAILHLIAAHEPSK
ncbi:MAG TPA: sugar ABC transporter ATP-binding protein [Firmicutes bacterium]|nr:sugar ABC transporter ATP-binding protein [Bacillota bacterium]